MVNKVFLEVTTNEFGDLVQSEAIAEELLQELGHDDSETRFISASKPGDYHANTTRILVHLR